MSPLLSGTQKLEMRPGAVVHFSSADADLIQQHVWRPATRGKKVYAQASVGDILMHRLIMLAPAGMFVDHIDGNGLNNTRQNLRLVNTTQNRWNARTNSLSGFRGVSKSGNGFCVKWVTNGQSFYAGYWRTAIEAALAYNDIVRAQRGDHAALNVVNACEARAILQARLGENEQERSRLARWIEALG